MGVREGSMIPAKSRGMFKSSLYVCLLGLSLCLWGPSASGQPAANPPALTAAAPVAPVAKITGTTVVLLDISGSTGDVVRLESVPVEALNHCTKRMLGGREVLEFYWPGHPRTEFLVFASSGASSECARFIVPADGVPGPDPPVPPVPPNPPPGPDPPLPTTITDVIIVSQTEDRTPAQATVILSTEWRKHLDDVEIPFQCLDQDQLPQQYQPLAAKAAGKATVFFIGDAGVEEAAAVPLPVSATALQNLIQERVK